MKFYPTKIIKLITPTFMLFLFFSCTTDSDLLTDMVLEDAIVNETSINVNDAKITVEEDKAVSFNMLNNVASKGSRRQYKSSKQPKNGGLVIQKDSIAVYTPDFDFNGKDSIEITLEEINEDNTTSDVTMTVEVTVNPTADVIDDKVETTQGTTLLIEPLKNDNFNENSNVRISQTSNASKGSIVINDDNTLTYTPNSGTIGIDLFTYTVEITHLDESVTTETGNITVTINSSGNSGSSVSSGDMGPLKAFPGAEGFGKNATGGRGGAVLFVTNLNDSGPGSFRAAVEASGRRTVVFRVGGTIDLGGAEIYINNPDLTIAGETAPGDGIAIKDGSLAIYTSNVIVKHLRFRGSESPISQLRIKGSGSLYSFNINRIIIDHCSFSWAKDQTLSVVKAKDVTIQNSFITGTIKSILAWANKDLSVLNNIMALSDTRNITTNQQLGTYLQYEQINNLVYGFNWGVGHGQGMMGTVENNIFERSNSFSGTSNVAMDFTAINPDYINTSNVASMTYVYVSGNTIDGSFSKVVDTPDNSWLKGTPLYRSSYKPKPTAGLKDELLLNAGAFPWNRDSVDKNVIAHIKAKTGTLSKSRNYPTIKDGSPYTDADKDGMDDNWELANNLNPNDSSDGQKDRNGDGYTNLEEFLYFLTQK